MNQKALILLLSLMLIPGLCFAEFYKYRDANGNIRFTDNLGDVPVDQRENVKEYRETITPEATEEPVDKPMDLNVRADQLNAERDMLEKEYAELEKERESLEQTTRDPQNDADYEAYKSQVDAYNNRIKSYEEKRKQFQLKVDAFNRDAKNQ
jgi:hypothetical protein